MKAKTKNKIAKMQEVQAKKYSREKRKWIIKQLRHYNSLPPKLASSYGPWLNFEEYKAQKSLFDLQEQVVLGGPRS